jgi:hypothetical protein
VSVRVAVYARGRTAVSARRHARRTLRHVGGGGACAVVVTWYVNVGAPPRPALAGLVADAAARRFDLLVVDQVDLVAPPAGVLGHLPAAGVAVHVVGAAERRRRSAARWAAAATWLLTG